MTYAPHAIDPRIASLLVLPDDPRWDSARQAWNLAADQRPAAIALPETADDVAAIVRFARAGGLRVAAQATGHNAAPLRSLDDTVLVKLERMRTVEIDPEARVARVGAGVVWAEASAAAAPHGLAALAGSSPDVGVAGYTLGGGLSWLLRKYGLATNSVEAIELVGADGELLRADRDTHPGLFWALRGGGGSFGVVTALEFRLYPVREVYAGALLWPIERAAEVLSVWRAWTEAVPDEVSSSARLLHMPPIAEIPAELRGGDFVAIDGAYLGDEDGGRKMLEPLRSLKPHIDGFTMLPAAALAAIHMDPPEPVPVVGDGALIRALPAAAIDALVEVEGAGSCSPLLLTELRQLGGAAARSDPDHGALDRIEAPFAFFTGGLAFDEQSTAAINEQLARLFEALAPWDAKANYMNFTEQPTDVARMFPDGVYELLRAVKSRYDPDDLFRSNHPIPPLAGGEGRNGGVSLRAPS